MQNTVNGKYKINTINDNEQEVIFKGYRIPFIALTVFGFILTVTLLFALIGVPLLVVGAICLFIFRPTYKIVFVKNGGIKFSSGWSENQIPFGDISEVAYFKSGLTQLCTFTVTTKGKRVSVASNISEGIALELKQMVMANGKFANAA